MKINRILFLAVFFLAAGFPAKGMAGDLRERIYLQTDKDAYIAGEIVWLKAVTTDRDGRPLTFSKVAYVEIVDGSNAVQHQDKFDVVDGVAAGSIVLPPTLPTGTYRLIAYTRYMRNEGENVFFEKEIIVANPNKTDPRATVYVSPAVVEIDNDQDVAPGGENFPANISTDKNSYGKRNKVKVSLGELPADIYTLSVSVTGEGFIESRTKANIVSWKEGLVRISSANKTSDYIPEYEGHIVEGIMVDRASNTPAFDERLKPLISFAGDKLRVFGGKADRSGNVFFVTRNIAGADGLAASINGEYADLFRIDIKQPYVSSYSAKELPAITADMLDNDLVLRQSVAVQVQYAYLGDEMNRLDEGRTYWNIKPAKSYSMADYARFPTMAEVITEFVSELKFRKIDGRRYLFLSERFYAGHPAKNTLVLVDGIPIIDHEIIYNYNPLLVKRIDIYPDKYFVGNNVFEGIAFFVTDNQNYPDLEPDPSTTFSQYSGTRAQRGFYSPLYTEQESPENGLPDYRHTLYWDPDVDVTSSDKLEFYTSDISGKYNVTVEGITEEGVVLHFTTSFTVE